MENKKGKTKLKKISEFESLQTLSSNALLRLLATVLGFTFFTAGIWGGSKLGGSLSSPLFAFAVILGNSLLGAFCLGISYICCKTRFSVDSLIEYGFGTEGANIISFLMIVVHVSWIAISFSIITSLVKVIFPFFDKDLITAVLGAIITLFYLAKTQSFTFLSIITLIGIVIIGLMTAHNTITVFGSWQSWWHSFPNQEISIYWAIGVVFGSLSKESLIAPNIMRNESFSLASGVIILVFIVLNTLVFGIGALCGSMYEGFDMIQSFFKQGLIVWTIVTVGSNIVTVDNWSLNLLGTKLPTLIKDEKIKKPAVIIATGLICIVISGILYRFLFEWMYILSVIVPAIGGVLMADFFVIKKGRVGTHYHARRLKGSGMSALLAGIGASTFLPGLACVNSFAISIIVYTVWMKLDDKRN